MKRKSLIFIGFLAFSIFLLNRDFALGHTWEVHENVLSEKAGELLKGKCGDRYKEVWGRIVDGGYFDDPAGNNNDIKEGSGEEDNPKKSWWDIDLSAEAKAGSWMRHYYNPITRKGLWWYPSTIEYGETIWSEAIWKYRHGDKENAYYKLGRVLHLLEDMSSVQI